MTVEDYKEELKRHQASVAKMLVKAISALAVSLIVAGYIRWKDGDLADTLALVVIFLIGGPLMIYGIYRCDQVYRAFPMLICQNCNENLASASSTVIATGNCPNCGRRVLDDPSIGS